jgi:hypothetical protein
MRPRLKNFRIIHMSMALVSLDRKYHQESKNKGRTK